MRRSAQPCGSVHRAKGAITATSMRTLVSILIPAFNEERWIGRAIESALAQTWPHTEVIVVDDGSTDATARVASRAGSSRVKVETRPHLGAAAARNAAFRLSQGDYIQWLDADDLLAPDKIEQQMAAIGARPSARTLLSGAWGSFMYSPAHARFRPTALWCDLPPELWLLRKMESNLYMQTATWLVTRFLTEAAGPWDERLSTDDDGEYFCRVLMNSDTVRFVPHARVFYRMPDATRLSAIGLSAARMDSLFRSTQLHIAYLRSFEDSDMTRHACLMYLQRQLVNISPERRDIFEQAHQLAVDLGGRLQVPRPPWKYAVVGAVLGQRAAHRARIALPQLRWSIARQWDMAVSHVTEWIRQPRA